MLFHLGMKQYFLLLSFVLSLEIGVSTTVYSGSHVAFEGTKFLYYHHQIDTAVFLRA